MTDEERPPESTLWTLLRGAMVTKALGIVAELRIADALSDGPRPVSDLAAEAEVDEDALYRVLRALASDGVFAEEDGRAFRNTPLSDFLRADHPQSWHDITHLFGDVWYRTFAEADTSVRTGNEAFPRTFGTDFWSWLEQHPDEGASFNRAMASGAEENLDPLGDVSWRDGETVVDVGGGNGATLIALLRRQPELRGIVFDLPETAREAETLVAASDVADRCRVAAGSFFDTVPAGDVYVLSAILHDWDDEPAKAILRSIRSSAPPHARVLIRDSVIPPGNEPHGNKWLDLLMLILSGGRERTELEWRALVERAELELTAIEDGLIQLRCP
jgi:SAM-dependent methyltransferase